jgi:diadenylate cyclase
METLATFLTNYWKLILEVILISCGLVGLRRLLKPVGVARILIEVIMGIAALMLLAHWLDMVILRTLLGLVVAALVVVFQPELRHAFVTLLGEKLFKPAENVQQLVDLLTETTTYLSHNRTGALIALERGMGLKQFAETGAEIDATFNPALVYTIFHHKTALHDGGMILQEGRIQAAGCLFPVSQRELADRSLGLRHRAALGITEQTDAIAIVVSEETGRVSIALGGNLEPGLTPDALSARLRQLLAPKLREEPKLREAVGNITSRLQA